ncbi:MAG: hypothetical protein OXC92_05710 [Flavobacteriaceae bacterium]|nr:hypothetical protein [Flavobacteriaceae bacterium]MCY4216462.1 hypothetical protein [Flavobacteriaceae bacterium]MCY4253959.1 hypothetical protein [Flavobacteriaceae bacterium]
MASKKNIIRDFIYNGGGLDQTIEYHLWVHKISEQTNGWPQHISAYGHSASNYLQHRPPGINVKPLTGQGLDEVLNDGKRKRFQY